jgi:hypothetical protein
MTKGDSMLRRKAIVGIIVVGLALVAGYRYWISSFDFDSSGLHEGDGKTLLRETFGPGFPTETTTVMEKIKSGFGNDYSVEGLYLLPEKLPITTTADCQKYGLSKGGAIGEVLAAEKVNITQLDKTLILKKIGVHAPTCYRRVLAIDDGELRISLIIMSGKYVLFLDSHT